MHPDPDALLHAQDKLVMRRAAGRDGSGGARFAAVHEPADVQRFGDAHGWPVVLKAVRGGYDGRGVWMLDGPAPVVTELLAAGTPLMVESTVPMRRELAALVARSPYGQAAAWPVVETVQARRPVRRRCSLRRPGSTRRWPRRPSGSRCGSPPSWGSPGCSPSSCSRPHPRATVTTAGRTLVVNELAMRPHNSGHWTIEGARTSQFEQHLRAVLDYPLGATAPTAPAVVMANVLGAAGAPTMSLDERVHHLFARFPDVKVHLYGKAERPARKVGHVTALGDEMAPVRARAALAAGWLAEGEWADGWSPHRGAPRQEVQRV